MRPPIATPIPGPADAAAGLDLPGSFPDDAITIIPKITASNGITSACWYHEVRGKQTATRFKGRYDPRD